VVERGNIKRQSCDNTATSRDCWGDYSIDTNWYVTRFSTLLLSLKCILSLVQRDGHVT
jgi:hypothetical protein